MMADYIRILPVDVVGLSCTLFSLKNMSTLNTERSPAM